MPGMEARFLKVIRGMTLAQRGSFLLRYAELHGKRCKANRFKGTHGRKKKK